MLSLLLAVLVTAEPVAAQDVYALSDDTFTATVKSDLVTLKRLINGMQQASQTIADNKTLFETRSKSVLSPEQKRLVLGTWGTLFAYSTAAESLRQKYWNFVTLLPNNHKHAWGFLMTHTALTALLAHGMSFVRTVLNNTQLETLFDEANDEYGVPKGAFARFKAKSIQAATSTQLMTGDAWAPTAESALKSANAFSDEEVTWAWKEMTRDALTAREQLKARGVKLWVGNTIDTLKDRTFGAVFPVQKSFAEWAGDTRVARKNRSLVTVETAEKLALPKLQPGDIVVSRQNWFVSNIGLPGFWPHAMLYVGTKENLSLAFDTEPSVVEWVKQEPEKVATFTALLAKRFPTKWKTYSEGTDFQGHGPIRVIESISEGVSFTAIEHAFGVDYLAGIRPEVPAVEKAQAIVRAFNYVGRPYDFNFDFFSDSALVCTELVFKSYQPAASFTGVPLDLVDVAGRRTLPANDIVKQFDAQLDKPGRSMSFVFFVDAIEKDLKNFAATQDAFRSSWKRVKWDVAVK